MSEFPLEREAEKPEIQLNVVVYFHADVVAGTPQTDGIDIHAGELGERSEAIRYAINNALREDEALAEYAYGEVRLGDRTIAQGYGHGSVTIDASNKRK